MKPKFSKCGALLGTAIFLGSLAMPAFAVEIAGNLLIDLDPADYIQGEINWNQHSATPQSIQGPFVKNANGTPQKTILGGATAIVLDGGGDYFVGPKTTAVLHGAGVPHSVEYWAFQGQAKPEEAVVSWSSRGGPAGTFAGFRYGTQPDYGAVARWGQPDMGYAGGIPELGKWHLITVTFDGSIANGGTNTQRLYVDGVLNATEVSVDSIDAKDNLSINIGGERDNGNDNFNPDFQFSGGVGKVRIHSGVLTDVQVAANYNAEKASYPGITPEPLPRAPLHRFSFNNPVGPAPAGSVITDSIGGLTAKIVGDGASFTGTKVQLPGGAPDSKPAYVDLPNGLLSSKGRVSLEVWSTQTANQNWSRLMTFGNSSIGEVTTAGNDPSFGGTNGLVILSNFESNPHYRLNRLGGTITNGADFRQMENASSLNTQLHQVVVYDRDRKEWRMYRNGYLMASLPESQGPTTVQDVNNWLGRSDFGGDNGFTGTFDEFRVYNYTLTESQIRGNTLAGPDTVNVTSTFAQAGWLPTAGGTFSYNTAANWNPATVPNGPGVTANIVSNLVGDQTVTLDTAVTVGAMTLGDSDGSNQFTLAAGSGGSLTFNGGSGNPAVLTLNDSTVGNIISAPLTLATTLKSLCSAAQLADRSPFPAPSAVPET